MQPLLDTIFKFCLGGYPVALLGLSAAAFSADLCETPGHWIDPDAGTVIQRPALFEQLSTQQVVLLGESHDNPEHHRWQLHTLAAIRAQGLDLVLGFEMFSRGVQAVLDRWVAGELDEQAFLRAVDWEQSWGFDADLYLPLFHFARMNKIPMVALNVDRALVRAVAKSGWGAVPVGDRQGVGDPAPAATAYREELAEVFLTKMHAHQDSDSETAISDDPLATLADEPGFQHFVEAQLTWDRAMAEALASAREAHRVPLAVGIMGQGHVLHGYGVSHQLKAMGVERVSGLVPLAVSDDCEGLSPTMAAAVYTVAAFQPTPVERPRLGVMIEDTEDGARVTGVVDDSVAAGADLRVDDVIVQAAGENLGSAGDLIRVVQRQAPGTWLPLKVRRGVESLDLVARFPATERR